MATIKARDLIQTLYRYISRVSRRLYSLSCLSNTVYQYFKTIISNKVLSKKTALWIRPCHLCIEYYFYSPFKFVYSRLISGWVSRMWTEMGFSATLSLRWALQETFSLIFKPDSSRLYSSVDLRNKFVPISCFFFYTCVTCQSVHVY